MVRQNPFQSSGKLYENYYCNQVGHGLPVFVGGRNYRGRGIGNLLGGIGRAIVPLLKSGGKALLKEGARTGMQVAQDVLSGHNVKSSLKQRANEAGKRLFQQAVHRVTGAPPAPPGEPARKRIKSTTPRRAAQTGHKKKKRKRKRTTTADIFG